MNKPSRRGTGCLVWRGQTASQERNLTRDCEELIQRGRVAAEVDARTGGLCYYEGCGGRIISYPHALPVWEGGTHDAINRAGVCATHGEGMHHSRDSRGGARARLDLQDWLQRWYADHEGLTPAEWRTRAVRPGARRISDTG